MSRLVEPGGVDRVGRVVTAVLLVGFAALVAHQAIRPLVGVRRNLEAFREAIVILADAEGSVETLDLEIRAVTEDIRRSRSMLPPQLNLDAFLQHVGEVARTTDTHIVRLTPQAETEHRLFRELMLDVHVSGRYPAIRDFLARLEHGEQLSRVEQIRLTRDAGTQDCSANVRLALYFAPDSKG